MASMRRELVTMNEIAAMLEELSHDERRRVILWLEDYFEVFQPDLFDDFDSDDEYDDYGEDISAEESNDEVEPLTFASFYEKVAPKTAIQKIVTAAYWLQTQEGKESWKSFEVNKLLKSLGVKVTSVSGTLAIESKKDEPMIETLSKSGDSIQARKTFRLSDAGIAFVEGRLA